MPFIKKYWKVVSVIVVGFLAYGQTLRMYFWQDDSALIFKLQYPGPAAGSFGTGIIGQGPYKYLVTPFVPFFPMFKLEPFWYFLVGFITFFITVYFFYIFTKNFFSDNKNLAYAATIIYSAGYVGSDIMFRIINSWQTNIGIVLSLLALTFYVKHLQKNKVKDYLLSLLFFLAAIEFVFIRSHSLVFAIIALDILYFNFRRFILRVTPFVIIFYSYYIKGGTMGSSSLSGFAKSILGGKLEALMPLLATTGHGFVPTVLQNRLLVIFPAHALFATLLFALVSLPALLWLITKKRTPPLILGALLAFLYFANFYLGSKGVYWYENTTDLLAGSIGLYIGAFIVVVAYNLWRKNKTLSGLLMVGYVFYVSQIFSYYVKYPTSIFGTTHRYLHQSIFGYSIIFTIVFALLVKKVKGKYIKFAPLFVLVVVNLFLGFRYQSRLVRDRSVPSRQFYADLKEFVPSINKGSLLYFDIQSDHYYQKQFGDFFSVGSMPNSTALAIYYGVDRYDLKLITDFDELVFELDKGETDVSNVYTFFYGSEGLVDTTELFRERLGNNNTDTEALPVTFSALTLRAKVTPMLDEIVYPYSSSGARSRKYTKDEKLLFLRYLQSRKRYYQAATATSLSEWKYEEVDKIVDSDKETRWRGHRIYWHNNRNESLTIDLGRQVNVGKVAWTVSQPINSPSKYSLFVSVDNANWKKVVDMSHAELAPGQIVEVPFPEAVDVRYVRMDIDETPSTDSPMIAEIEVVGSEFSQMSVAKARDFEAEPFYYIEDVSEMGLLLSSIPEFLPFGVVWTTDKGKNSVADTVGSFYDINEYEFILPSGGTKFVNINIIPPHGPFDLDIVSQSINNLNMEQIQSQGLIREFSEN